MPTTRAPSITRLFAAPCLAGSLVGRVTQIATWRSSRSTQAAMVEVAQRLTRIQQHNPSPDVAAEASAASELAADAGDDVVQAALAASVLFAPILLVLALAFCSTRRRLAEPFSRIVQALSRVAEGQFHEPLPENQPDPIGTTARGAHTTAEEAG